MARKSRKKFVSEQKVETEQRIPFSVMIDKIPTASYGRLSVEEEADGQSRA